MNEDKDFTKEIRSLETKLNALEELSNESTTDGPISPELLSQIMKRINAVQNLVDQIEIEIDKLEMRVSAIEHMGFRFRTGGL
jgi:hypothetical protein